MDPETLTQREKTRFLTVITSTLLVLSLFLVVQIFNSVKEFRYIGADIAPQVTMSFAGEGEVLAVPDVAEFTFTLREEVETVEAAQRAVAEKTQDITEYLLAEGVEERYVKTVGYNVRPRYEYHSVDRHQPAGERVLVGYEVTQNTQVTVKDMDRAGELVGGVGQRGATQISNVIFSVEDETEIKWRARQLAIEDAKTRAERLAQDLGMTLIRVVDFQENRSPSFPEPYMARDILESVEVDAPTPGFSPGEQEIVSRVEITYEIR